MSDNILPFEMQEEILKRLAVKPLIQLRSVSKQWKSLIDNPRFIHDHTTANHNQPHHHHHLLVRYKLNSEQEYISIFDNNDNDSISDIHNDNDDDSISGNDNDTDNTFPQQRFSVTAPRTLSLLTHALVLGSSRGLLCFFGLNGEPGYKKRGMAVLWNPSIRKCVGVDVPNDLCRSGLGYAVIGFGVCSDTSDPKLVKVNHILSESEPVTWEVEIFTLSSRDWRNISIKMPRTPIYLSWSQVVIDGVIYWKAYDKKHPFPYDGVKLECDRIISFDLTNEEFGEVFLPDHLANASKHIISKLMGSLVVLENRIEENGELVFVVWKLEHSVPKSFKKLFAIKVPDNAMVNRVLSFCKNGEPIMSTVDDYRQTNLYAYEHNSGRFKGLWIFPSGNGDRVTSCSVTSYRETLLLLDKPNAIIH